MLGRSTSYNRLRPFSSFHRIVSKWAGALLGVCALMALLAACSVPGGGSSIGGAFTSATTVPTAAATPLPQAPAVPAVRSLSIAGFEANDVYPMKHGLLLRGTSSTVPHPLGEVGAPELGFYNFTSQQVLSFVTATPAANGAARGIQEVKVSGDWAAYILADAHQAHWELWAFDTYTGQKMMVDSAATSGQPAFFGVDSFTTDGQSLVWSHNLFDSSDTVHAALLRYSFATGQRTQLLSESGKFITPLASSQGDVLYYQASTADTQTTTDPTDGDCLLASGQTTATQLSSEQGSLGDMNTRYIVWEVRQSQSLALYDRSTRQITASWGPNCLKPVIAQAQLYAVCLDFDAQAFDLIGIPSGLDTQFALGQVNVSSVYGFGPDGNFYWVASGPTAPASDMIHYIPLPTN